MSVEELYDNALNPTLGGVIRLALKGHSSGLRVALPGKVESFDPVTQMVDVKPLLLVKKEGVSAPEEISVIPRVPIAYPRTKAATVYLPIAAGDPVLLIFGDRAMDAWKASDGSEPVSSELFRLHDLTDCWAIPGGSPTGDVFVPPYGDDVFQIITGPETKIAVGNGTDELLTLANDAFTELKDAATELKNTLTQLQIMTMTLVTAGAAPSGPPDPTSVAAYAASEAVVDTILTAIDTSISSLANIKV